eukprot:CAMPEP_0172059008 /NCGR_PEP_ID=MMETSP1043-20130122/7184_1 /TAXON_ID=464988 /ORGANISM="Hemiselmis andersenii, Strain CCMP441" /LENGTH=180 /DNA_ID=CAMNT_0012718643 /DNA_START=94 /DNA_END=634 /DNA_ORIENTATION=-
MSTAPSDASDAGHALSLSGKANCRKDQGRLDEAVELYLEARAAAPRDPTFTFNLAQAYEYVQRYDLAVECIEKLMDALQPGEMTTVNHFAIPLLHLKLLFVAGPAYHARMQPVLDRIKGFPEVARQAVQKLLTHWAYYFFSGGGALERNRYRSPESRNQAPEAKNLKQETRIKKQEAKNK